MFLHLFVIRSFRGMGIRKGDQGSPRMFLALSGENIVLLLLPPLENPLLAPPWKKSLLAPMFRGTCSSIEMLKGCMARESLGTPVIDSRHKRFVINVQFRQCFVRVKPFRQKKSQKKQDFVCFIFNFRKKPSALKKPEFQNLA